MSDDSMSERRGSDTPLDELERKIRLTAELCRELRQENQLLNREVAALRFRIESLLLEKRQFENRIEEMMATRALIRERIESMLDAIATLEMEADSIRR